MRPLDRSVLPLLRSARVPLVVSVAATTLSGVLVVISAFVVTGLVVSLVDHHQVAGWGLAVVALFAGRAAATWVSDVAGARAAATVGVDLRSKVVAASIRSAAGLGGGGQVSPGAVATLCTRGITALEPYLTRFVPSIVTATTLPILTVVVIASQDLTSGLIVLVTLPLIPVFAALVGWHTQARAQRQWRELTVLSGHFLDVVKGLPTLVAYRRAEAQTSTIRRITHRYRRVTMDTLRVAFASSAVLELVATISVAMVAVTVGVRLAAGNLSLSTALVVLLLAPEAYWPLRRVGAEFHAAAEGGATLRQVAAVIGSPDDDILAPAVPPARPARVEFSDLTVTYPGRTEPALRPVSGSISRGELVAVSGPSGSGKTTLLAALRGAIPCDGTVVVDGIELAAVDERSWSATIAWMPQRPWFIAGTVRDNVTLGCAAADDASIWSALDRVGLAGRVGDLPGGLDADVAEDAASLSAGERARLALARTVVSDRSLVLLDEPTAHLDAESERVVLDTLRWLSDRCAVLVVAHRPAVLDAADRVIEVAPAAATLAPEPSGARRPEPPPLALVRDVDAPVAAEPDSATAAGVESTGSPRTRPTRTDADADDRSSGSRRLAGGIALGVLASLAGVALTATAGWLIVRASEQPPVLMLLVAIIAVRTFGIARPALRYEERLVSHDAALRVLADRRAQVYADLVPLTPGALGRRRGDLLASVVDDVDAEVDRRLRVWSPIVTGAGVGLVAGALVTLASLGAGVVIVALTAVSVITVPLVRWAATRAERSFVFDRAALSDRVTAAVEGADQLVSWQADGAAVADVDRTGRRLAGAAVRSALAGACGRAVVLIAVGVGVAVTGWAAAGSLASGAVSAPMAALVALVPLGLADVLVVLPDAGLVDARVRRALERLNAFATLTPLVSEPELAMSLPEDGADRLTAEAVSAGWGVVDVLHDVDLGVGPGRRIGVVGPSGCGKSTLAALLIRYLDPRSGVVRLGDVDVRELALADVRRSVGIVDDDPHMFASTVAENVRLASPDATDDEVETAIRAAQLGPWVEALPDGIDTFLGAQGEAVSGGERARIALARAVLADQPVVVLDEPAAHLDTATADAVLNDLLTASSARGVVLISHRPEGMDAVDEILDLGPTAEPTPPVPHKRTTPPTEATSLAG